jgi:hypothetical protein
MQKHIAHALQSRSQAIRTALDRYNESAKALSPPRPPLQWSEVMEYTFLADVDLLRDTRHGEDIRSHLWATPAGRRAMDMYFKVLRAQEEIQRLDVEIPRFVTYMQDEVKFLLKEEARVRTFDPALAHQIRLLCLEKSRYNAAHMDLFRKTSKVSGFNAKLTPGIHTSVASANGTTIFAMPLTAGKAVGTGTTHNTNDIATAVPASDLLQVPNQGLPPYIGADLPELSLEDKEYKDEEAAEQELEDIYEVFSCALIIEG